MAFDTLAYARRLREAGFTEQQAEGQAVALASAMTDSIASKHDLEALATRQDLHDLELRMEVRLERIDARFAQIDARADNLERRMDERFAEQDRRIAIRFDEHTARFDSRLADLERRMTMRLGGITVAGISVVSALVKVL
jgi:hypothetical protein